ALHAFGSLSRIDDHARPLRVLGQIAMLLPAVGIGLIERDAMAERGEVADDAAVIRGRAVPVGAHEAAGEEGDVHREADVGCRLSVVGWVAPRDSMISI